MIWSFVPERGAQQLLNPGTVGPRPVHWQAPGPAVGFGDRRNLPQGKRAEQVADLGPLDVGGLGGHVGDEPVDGRADLRRPPFVGRGLEVGGELVDPGERGVGRPVAVEEEVDVAGGPAGVGNELADGAPGDQHPAEVDPGERGVAGEELPPELVDAGAELPVPVGPVRGADEGRGGEVPRPQLEIGERHEATIDTDNSVRRIVSKHFINVGGHLFGVWLGMGLWVGSKIGVALI